MFHVKIEGQACVRDACVCACEGFKKIYWQIFVAIASVARGISWVVSTNCLCVLVGLPV